MECKLIRYSLLALFADTLLPSYCIERTVIQCRRQEEVGLGLAFRV